MKTIILFKASPPEEVENSYETLLTKENFKVFSIKTLVFEFLNLQELKTCLEQPANYAGILFTSPRCVTSVQRALSGDSLRDEWNTKKNYGVGPKTVECAYALLGLRCFGAEACNASNLSDLIASCSATDKQFLYPKGNLSRDLLKQKVNVHDIIVYETVTNTTLEQDLVTATANFHTLADYVVFFSPSGVKATLPYFSKLNHARLKVIAIGPTSEAALLENHISVHGIPTHPSAESLVILLKTLDN